MTKSKCDARYHPSTIAAVLRVFITSGSADGDEPTREWLLDRAEMFAAAPALLEACRAIANETTSGRKVGAKLDRINRLARAAIALATEGGGSDAAATQ